MNESIKSLLIAAHGHDTDAMYILLQKFNPLIRKYSRMLNYDGTDSDLIIALIELVYGLPERQLQQCSEAQLVLMIKNCFFKTGLQIRAENRLYRCNQFEQVIKTKSIKTKT